MSRRNRERRARKKASFNRPDGLILVPGGLLDTHSDGAWQRAAREAERRDLSGCKVLTCALLAGGTGIVHNVVIHRGREVLAHLQVPPGPPERVGELMGEHGGERLYFVIASPRTHAESEWYWLVDPRDQVVYRTRDFQTWEVATSPGDWDQIAIIDEIGVGS